MRYQKMLNVMSIQTIYKKIYNCLRKFTSENLFSEQHIRTQVHEWHVVYFICHTFNHTTLRSSKLYNETYPSSVLSNQCYYLCKFLGYIIYAI